MWMESASDIYNYLFISKMHHFTNYFMIFQDFINFKVILH